jgi:hypothetical protein
LWLLLLLRSLRFPLRRCNRRWWWRRWWFWRWLRFLLLLLAGIGIESTTFPLLHVLVVVGVVQRGGEAGHKHLQYLRWGRVLFLSLPIKFALLYWLTTGMAGPDCCWSAEDEAFAAAAAGGICLPLPLPTANWLWEAFAAFSGGSFASSSFSSSFEAFSAAEREFG